MTGIDVFLLAALISIGFFALATLLTRGRSVDRMQQRLHRLANDGQPVEADQARIRKLARAAVPRLVQPLLPRSQTYAHLQVRLVHAGFYGPQAVAGFYAVKAALLLFPWALGAGLAWFDMLAVNTALLLGGSISMLGLTVPNLWLARRIKRRQAQFRRVLPDLLDVLSICLEGGSSLAAGFRRVHVALQNAHPFLARELTLLEREMQLGCPLSEALHHWAQRTDLEELFTLASVVGQSEKFGSGLLDSLRVQADVLREQGLQRAEERAHKAGVKIIFPTILFLFPGIFIILLGPATIQIQEIMMKHEMQEVLEEAHDAVDGGKHAP